MARAVYRATPAVSSPLGGGTAVEVEAAAGEVAWPQQPAAEVGGCTTSLWGSRAMWRGSGLLSGWLRGAGWG